MGMAETPARRRRHDEHGRSGLPGDCTATHSRIADKDEGALGGVDLVLADGEDGAALSDEVQLLVAARAAPELVVLFDHRTPFLVGLVGVDAERLNPEMDPNGLDLELRRGADRGDRVERGDGERTSQLGGDGGHFAGEAPKPADALVDLRGGREGEREPSSLLAPAVEEEIRSLDERDVLLAGAG
jgi:hypothetical protein